MNILDVAQHYVISLPHQREKLSQFMWRAQSYAGIQPTLEPGILTRSHEGLIQAQLAILERAQEQGAESVAIYEDDCIFSVTFPVELKMAEIPDDWQLLHFGCLHVERPTITGRFCVRVARAFDTHALAFRGDGIPAAIKALSEHKGPASLRLSEIHRAVPTYALFPNACWQGMGWSDIARREYSNYDEKGRQVWGREMAAPFKTALNPVF